MMKNGLRRWHGFFLECMCTVGKVLSCVFAGGLFAFPAIRKDHPKQMPQVTFKGETNH